MSARRPRTHAVARPRELDGALREQAWADTMAARPAGAGVSWREFLVRKGAGAGLRHQLWQLWEATRDERFRDAAYALEERQIGDPAEFLRASYAERLTLDESALYESACFAYIDGAVSLEDALEHAASQCHVAAASFEATVQAARRAWYKAKRINPQFHARVERERAARKPG